MPYPDEEIVSDTLACMEVGAALTHNHTDELIDGIPGRVGMAGE